MDVAKKKIGSQDTPHGLLTTPIFVTIGNKLGVGEIEIEVTFQQIILE